MDAIPSNLGGFAIAAEQVTPLVSPSDFYNELISRSQKAQRRIVLTSLYLGSGDMEQKLVATLRDTIQARKDVKVSILLDYLRGTRGVAEGKSSICLLRDIAANAQVCQFLVFFLIQTLDLPLPYPTFAQPEKVVSFRA